jgi:tetratricopeptide (TPR) repeat protein
VTHGQALEPFVQYASATMLDSLIELDTNNISKALDSFLLAFKIRQPLVDPDIPFIASSLNALSIAHTKLSNFDRAVETGQRAIDIRLRTKSDRIGSSYSNMATTIMRMGNANEAEEMLKRCPSLKDFTDETFLQTGNPRFSG